VGHGVAGPGLCEGYVSNRRRKVAQKDALDGLLDMRKDSDAKAAPTGQRGRDGNRWIKCVSPIDLKGMRPEPIRQLAGALRARAGLSENRRMRRSLLT
jgi:hypothetical protein